MISEAVVAEGFKIAMSELHQMLKKKSSFFAKQKNIDIENGYLKASKVEEVKTIWQIDKNVNLNEFYYPSKIAIESSRIEIGSLGDLPENGKIIIQGTAGQGKSIFLRYLTGHELKYGKSIPVFVELRRITDRLSLESLIINSLSNLGIECDSVSIHHIYESNKSTLILDAFDEVKESQVTDTITYLEDLRSKYHGLRIIISSRANSGVQFVTHFRVLDMCPLISSDFPPMLNKFFEDDDDIKTDDIVKAIHDNESGIAGLITTPLLLTLLTITYKSYHKIPEKLHEFYDNLFYLLVNRHDSTKPGFTRKFKSGLNENELEKLFCAFCFHSMIKNKDTLTNSEAMDLVSKAKVITNLCDVSENNFLEDTKNNTCLIIEEGFEYHFIHKSIKEYHAAKFVSKSPVQLKEKFYKLAIKNPSQFQQEITYLENIDNYYCEKLFLMPAYEGLFLFFEYKNNSIGKNKLILDDLEVGLTDGNLKSFSYRDYIFGGNSYFHFVSILLDIFRLVEVKDEHLKGDVRGKPSVLYRDTLQEIYHEHVLAYLNEKHKKYIQIKEHVTQQEEAINDLDF